jgi:hypothetical protein
MGATIKRPASGSRSLVCVRDADVPVARLLAEFVTRTLFVNFCSLVFTAGALADVSRGLSGAKASDPKPLVGEWLAAGSGCKGTESQPGNVRILPNAPTGASDLLASARRIPIVFELDGYRLRPLEQSAKGATPNLLHYARECALRVSLNPPSGMRIGSVTARASTELSKDKSSELVVNAVLKVGSLEIAQEQRLYDGSNVFRNRKETLELISGRRPDQVMPTLQCGESKIIGLDLTFLTKKQSKEALAEARVVDGGRVTIDVGLEECGL